MTDYDPVCANCRWYYPYEPPGAPEGDCYALPVWTPVHSCHLCSLFKLNAELQAKANEEISQQIADLKKGWYEDLKKELEPPTETP